MFQLRSLKIGGRLAIGFAVILGLTLLVGLGAVNRLGAVNDATADLATNWLPATRYLGDYQANVNGQRRAEALFIMSGSEEARSAERARLQTAQEQSAAAWKLYAATVTAGDEQKLAAAVLAAEQIYAQERDKALDL